MSVSYKFSSCTLLQIHEILYFTGDFNRSVWSLPLCHNVKFHHASHRNRDLSQTKQIATKNATEKRQMRAYCVAEPVTNQRRKFLRRPDTNPTQGKNE